MAGPMEADDMVCEHGSIYKVSDFDLVKYMVNSNHNTLHFVTVYLAISNKLNCNDNLIFYEEIPSMWDSTTLTKVLSPSLYQTISKG